MAAADLSIYDLYFFAGFIRDAAKKHKTIIAAILEARYGADWYEQLDSGIKAYEGAVDRLAKELAEASDATKNLDDLFVRLAAWRRLMESAARNAPANRKSALLRAAGYGLGSPQNDRELREFLAEVAPLVELRAKDFRGCKVNDDALGFPREALAIMQQGGTEVIKEKSDASVARKDMHRKRLFVAERVDAVDAAATQVHNAALFSRAPTASADRDLAEALVAQLDASLNEAKVQARKKADADPALNELIVTPPQQPEPEPTPAPKPVDAPQG